MDGDGFGVVLVLHLHDVEIAVADLHRDRHAVRIGADHRGLAEPAIHLSGLAKLGGDHGPRIFLGHGLL